MLKLMLLNQQVATALIRRRLVAVRCPVERWLVGEWRMSRAGPSLGGGAGCGEEVQHRDGGWSGWCGHEYAARVR